MEDLLQFTNEDIAGAILDETFDEVFSVEFTQGLTELRLDAPICVPSDDLFEFDWLSSFDSKTPPDNQVPQAIDVSRTLGNDTHNYDLQRLVNIPDRMVHEDSKCCVANSYGNIDSLSRSPTSVLDSNFKQSNESCNSSSFPARPRSKRSRAMSRSWSSNLLSEFYYSNKDNNNQNGFVSPDNGAMSGNETYSDIVSSDFSPCNSLTESGDSAAYNNNSSDLYSAADSGGKKLNVKFSGLKASVSSPKRMRRKRLSDNPLLRRCNHCSTTKTPQWRAGPDGPKTLCNACGVRYKSGRLLPEYRPAGSPGYIFNRHSNSHRKILEMRRVQESNIPENENTHVFSADNPTVSSTLSESLSCPNFNHDVNMSMNGLLQ